MIWTLMVSYFIQKDTNNDRTMSNDRERIGDAWDLDRLTLLSELLSEMESVLELE